MTLNKAVDKLSKILQTHTVKLETSPFGDPVISIYHGEELLAQYHDGRVAYLAWYQMKDETLTPQPIEQKKD